MNSPRTGGILKGKKHSQCDHNGCGIKTVAGSVHKEAEGGEFLLSAAPLKSKKVITVTGTKRQIAEKINGAAGIVDGKQTLHVDPGQYVINARAMTDLQTFKVTGTPLQIASAINADKGYGIEFAPGAEINNKKLKMGGPVNSEKIGFNVKKFKNNSAAWEILDNSKAGDSADWMTGGCLILADAFNIAFGYSVYAIYNEDKKLIDHFVVKTPSGNYIDADGERKNIIDSFAKKEMITDKLKLVKFKSDMPIGEIPQDKIASKKLAEILKENINSSTKNIMATRKKSTRKLVTQKLKKAGPTSKTKSVNPTALAKEFSRLMRAELTPAQMNEAIEINKTPEYANACATHNYCDSNEVMIVAFENLAGRPYSFDESSTDHEITQKAWNIAREHDFYDNEKLAKGGPTSNSAPISVIPYNEDKYSSVSDYLTAAITDVFGKQNIYSGSADWGGIPVWTVNGGMYEGTFIVIDDNENVILMTRKFDEENEENIDTDIEQVDAPSPSELDSDPKTTQKKLLHLFKTAWSMKKSGKKLERGGPVSVDAKTQKQIDALEASIASAATPDNMKAAMRAKVAELKANAKPAKSKPVKSKPVSKTEILKFISSSKDGVTAEALESQFTTLSPVELSTALSDLEKAGKAHVNDDSMIVAGPIPKKADKNLLNNLKPKFNKQIDDYGITSAMIVDGELNTVSEYEIPADTAAAMEKHLKGQKGPEKGQKKAEPAKKAEPTHSGKTGSDLVEYVDKEIDGIIGKTLYFKAGANGKWIKGKIEAVEPFDKTKEHWNIEFYPVGGAKEFDAPMVSDKLTTKQLDEFIHGGELKKYTLTKPESEVIKDFDDAIKEIDICHEEAKSKRVSNQRKNPPVKKKPAEILKNKVSSLHGYALKRIEKKDPKKAPALKKILDRHKKELESFFAGKK